VTSARTTGSPARPAGSVRQRRLSPDALAELEDQRDVLLRALDDLDRERAAGELDEADYRALRDDYTHRAAELVRAVDSGRIAIAAGPRPGRARLLAVGAVVAVVAVGAGVAVATSSGTRGAGEFGSGEIRVLTDERLQEAAELVAAGDITGALERYDGVLEDDPANVEALLERGLLLASLSQAVERPELAETGATSVARALEVDPGNPRAFFYQGLIARVQGDEAAASTAFELALAADPAPVLRQQIRVVMGDVPAPGSAPAEGGADPPAPAPATGAP
jgi:tetratricopeptide (TPR) repeat protein